MEDPPRTNDTDHVAPSPLLSPAAPATAVTDGHLASAFSWMIWRSRWVDIPEGEDAESSDYLATQQGRDAQGIEWTRTRYTRPEYRQLRLNTYHNYLNLGSSVTAAANTLKDQCLVTVKRGRFYDFSWRRRQANSSIVHFQLRNLVWAGPHAHQVFYCVNDQVRRYDAGVDLDDLVLDLSWHHASCQVPSVGHVQISCMSVFHDLVAVGGFHGEFILRHLHHPAGQLMWSDRLSHGENAITNALEMTHARSGAVLAVAANNDAHVRVVDVERGVTLHDLTLDWSVNYAAVHPDNPNLILVVGDDPTGYVLDVTKASDGRTESSSWRSHVVYELKGHLDYSFAAAWHPQGGRLLATGNQDGTARVWDARYVDGQASAACLRGQVGAIRSLRFSPCGQYLAGAEPADFVHLWSLNAGIIHEQEIDLFGEIAGISFTPQGDGLYVGLSDPLFGGMLYYQKSQDPRCTDEILF